MAKSLITPEIKNNLFELALQPEELNESFSWHSDADNLKSSQVFCISAFGSLRNEQLADVRDNILTDFICGAFPRMLTNSQPYRWRIAIEVEQPKLLNELGIGQPTSIDVLFTSSNQIVALEAKFIVDAKEGFGRCSQYKKQNCVGFYGPSSDLKGKTQSWCRLESWDGKRSPRLYWAISKAYFKSDVFRMQSKGQDCPFCESNYQLMRNFLFAATLATKKGKKNFGVLVVCPKACDGTLRGQIEQFRSEILLESYRDHLKLVYYEDMIDLLKNSGNQSAGKLAKFLNDRIQAEVDQ
jgi:hypothetical protein